MECLNNKLLTDLLVKHQQEIPSRAESTYQHGNIGKQIELLEKVPRSWELEKQGGAWLAEARTWIQEKALNGESVTWGSQDEVKLTRLTVSDLETLAARIAAAAIREFKGIK